MSDWFIVEPSGTQLGPLPLQDLKTRIREGTLTRDTLVWTHSMLDWQPAKDTDLGEDFAKLPPPVPRTDGSAALTPLPAPPVQHTAPNASTARAFQLSEAQSTNYAAPHQSFIDAITICLSKYAVFSGRASRSEFWYWTLFSTLIHLAVGFLEGFFAGRQTAIGWIVALVIFLPGIAVQARRLHDIDRSGWWQLLLLVPIIGWIILIFWNCRRGVINSTRFD